MEKKKTKYETDLAAAEKTFNRVNFKYKDEETNEIYRIDGVKYIKDRNDDISKRLFRVVDELEAFTRSCSIPGVTKRWKELNPCISNFDAVYNFIKDKPELYDSIKACNGIVKFSFYPTKEDIENRDMYFKRIEEEDKKSNLQYSYSRIFQNELINTLKKVMLNDFPRLNKA